MSVSMQAMFIERRELEVAYGNLVVISEGSTVKASAIPQLHYVADILQARFGEFVPFVVGIGDELVGADILEVPGAFEMAWQTGLYGVPFEAFLNLADPVAFLTNFRVFNGMWGVVSAYTEDAPPDWESWLAQLYEKEGLVSCWWCIPDDEQLFYAS